MPLYRMWGLKVLQLQAPTCNMFLRKRECTLRETVAARIPALADSESSCGSLDRRIAENSRTSYQKENPRAAVTSVKGPEDQIAKR